MNLRDNLPLDQLPPEWVPDGMRFVTKAEYERLMTEMLHNRLPGRFSVNKNVNLTWGSHLLHGDHDAAWRDFFRASVR